MTTWGTNILLDEEETLFVTEKIARELKNKGVISVKNLEDILIVNDESDKIKILKHPKKDTIYVQRSQKAFDTVYDTLLATQILHPYGILPKLLHHGSYDKTGPLNGSQWLLFEYLKDYQKVNSVLPSLKDEKTKKALLNSLAKVCATLTKTGYWFDPRLSNFATKKTETGKWDVRIINLDLRREDRYSRSEFYQGAEMRLRQLGQQTINGKNHTTYFLSQYQKHLKPELIKK